MKQNYMSA